MYSEYAIVALVVSRGCSRFSRVDKFRSRLSSRFSESILPSVAKTQYLFFLAVVQQLAIFELHKYGKEAA